MIFSKLLLNNKHARLRTAITLLLAARIVLNFQIFDQPRNFNFSGASAKAVLEASKNFLQFDNNFQKKDSQNKHIQGSSSLFQYDEASIKIPKTLFTIFRSSVLSLINYSTFLSSHFSTDT